MIIYAIQFDPYEPPAEYYLNKADALANALDVNDVVEIEVM